MSDLPDGARAKNERLRGVALSVSAHGPDDPAQAGGGVGDGDVVGSGAKPIWRIPVIRA